MKTDAFREIAELNHKLNRIRGIDRSSFWGRFEILELLCDEEHEKIGERWRKFGRYGNVVTPSAMLTALERALKEAEFTREEFEEIVQWMRGQGTPDQAVGYIVIESFLKHYSVK